MDSPTSHKTECCV